MTFVFLAVASERRAWGYVDPGSGLLALQSAASMAAAATYFLRHKIKNLFSRKPAATAAATDSPVVVPITARKTETRTAA